MKLDDDFDLDEYDMHEKTDGEKFKSSPVFFYTIFSVILIMITILGLVVLTNQKPSNKENSVSYEGMVNNQSDVDQYISGSTLTASDLDFWHDYDEDNKDSQSSNEIISESDNAVLDPATDGKHIKIEYDNGTTEWLDINPYLALNTYNYSNLVYSNGVMKYYVNNVKSSFAGVDLSKNNDYVDFNKVKKAGIDYCMLKFGQRGYETGELSLDDNFLDNAKRAESAELGIGLYFYSQAITKEEAVEEAEYIIHTLSENAISPRYPIVFYMEKNPAGNSRTDKLNQLLRTNIAIAFMDRIKQAGYVPMIYGNKEYLLKKVSFGSLIGYDVWLNDEHDTPDFPYQFNMWKYTSKGNINGIAGFANVDICFTDYTIR